MSVYEIPTQINNEILLKKIKELQDQLKPEINPIIQKILPLPYDINKIILDQALDKSSKGNLKAVS